MSFSPLIKNRALSLTSNGDLESGLDILTQMAVAATAYHCIYDNTVNSDLIPFLSSTTTLNRIKITNILTNAYQSMISENIITDLQISGITQVGSTVNIRISAIDQQGNNITINWMN